jgi:hypothetical protein
LIGRRLAEIQGMWAGDDYFDAKPTVLTEMIKHHVKEEERHEENGMSGAEGNLLHTLAVSADRETLLRCAIVTRRFQNGAF